MQIDGQDETSVPEMRLMVVTASEIRSVEYESLRIFHTLSSVVPTSALLNTSDTQLA